LRRAVQRGDVVLFTDWTLLRLFPPLRSRWACVGTQAVVPITGQNAKRALFGTINLRTARRTVFVARNARAPTVRAFLRDLRRRYRRAGTIWLLADRASGHTAKATLALAAQRRIAFLWLPKQAPELNAMDQLWRELKRLVAANRQAATADALAADAAVWTLGLSSREARQKAGMRSKHFWLAKVMQDLWLPT
jgi:transposase